MNDRHACIVAVLLCIGCGTDPQNLPTAPPYRTLPRQIEVSPKYELAAAAAGRIERGTEDNILRLENYLPGLGGIYIDNGVLVAFVSERTTRNEALAGLARGATSPLIDEASRRWLLDPNQIRFREGQYPFSQIVAWAEKGGFASIRNLAGIDADEAKNRLTILVTDEAATPDVLSAAAKAGIPANAINIQIVGQQRQSVGLSDTVRPTAGGTMISDAHGQVCSLGFNVSNGPDERGFYTASHCAGGLGLGNTGAFYPVYQKYVTSSTRVGLIAVNPPWNLTLPSCQSIPLCTYVDAMYVRYDDSVVTAGHVDLRVAHTIGLSTPPTLNYGPISGYFTNINLGSYTPWVGMSVDKIGRTTGWTRGTFYRSCVDVVVGSGRSQHIVLCSDQADAIMVGEGDSGGPVFVGHGDSDTEVQALGIEYAFGGDTTGLYTADSLRQDDNNNYYYWYHCIMSYSRMTSVFLHVPKPAY